MISHKDHSWTGSPPPRNSHAEEGKIAPSQLIPFGQASSTPRRVVARPTSIAFVNNEHPIHPAGAILTLSTDSTIHQATYWQQQDSGRFSTPSSITYQQREVESKRGETLQLSDAPLGSSSLSPPVDFSHHSFGDNHVTADNTSFTADPSCILDLRCEHKKRSDSREQSSKKASVELQAYPDVSNENKVNNRTSPAFSSVNTYLGCHNDPHMLYMIAHLLTTLPKRPSIEEQQQGHPPLTTAHNWDLLFPKMGSSPHIPASAQPSEYLSDVKQKKPQLNEVTSRNAVHSYRDSQLDNRHKHVLPRLSKRKNPENVSQSPTSSNFNKHHDADYDDDEVVVDENDVPRCKGPTLYYYPEPTDSKTRIRAMLDSRDTRLHYVNEGAAIRNPFAVDRKVQIANLTDLLCVRTESGVYLCKGCSRTTFRLRAMQQHLLSHSASKFILCVRCLKGFNDKYDMKRHTRKHTMVRPYNCPECDRSFSQRCSLEGHRRKIHRVQLLYTKNERREVVRVCEICGFACSNVAELVAHTRFSHPDSSNLPRLQRQIVHQVESGSRTVTDTISDCQRPTTVDGTRTKLMDNSCRSPINVKPAAKYLSPQSKHSRNENQHVTASGFKNVTQDVSIYNITSIQRDYLL